MLPPRRTARARARAIQSFEVSTPESVPCQLARTRSVFHRQSPLIPAVVTLICIGNYQVSFRLISGLPLESSNRPDVGAGAIRRHLQATKDSETGLGDADQRRCAVPDPPTFAALHRLSDDTVQPVSKHRLKQSIEVQTDGTALLSKRNGESGTCTPGSGGGPLSTTLTGPLLLSRWTW